MTEAPPAGHGLDPETPLSVLRRFTIRTVGQDAGAATVTASMPTGGMRNPLTGLPSIAPLAILVDDVAGRVNYLRAGGRWTVSSELTVEVSPGAIRILQDDPEEPVVAAGRPLGPAADTMLSICTLTHRGRVIGGGAVRTVPISGGPERPAAPAQDPLAGAVDASLADLMAVQALPWDGGTARLRQRPDPMINNLIGIVHGGVSAAGLELAAAGAINHGQGSPLETASIRVNFLRPFLAGAQSQYEGTALRIGRRSAVADARAIDRDGTVAVIARVTAYR